MTSITLILGGARSGKSRAGEALITALPGPWTYIATAEPHDAEMSARIAAHRAQRQSGWRSVDAPLALADAITALLSARHPILIDCLTLWLSNVMLTGRDLEVETDRLLAVLATTTAPVVLVSNEVGLGIVPDNALARRFRDAQGRLNQRVASLAGRVALMVAGLPMILKGPPL